MKPTKSPRSVCVIGAGAAGLCALRHFTTRPESFSPIVCYEQTDKIGGTWNYTEEVGTDRHGLPVHTSMYRDLSLNGPMQIMDFPDFPYEGEKSYLHHTKMLGYLQDYAKHYNLLSNIYFEHTLVHVTRDDQKNKWLVTIRDLCKKRNFTQNFDIFLLCVGRYSDPYTPPFEGLSKFNGWVIHTHDYRIRDPYAGRAVAVIGGGPSGVDMMLETSTVAKKVVYVNRTKRQFTGLPENVRQIKGNVVRFTANSIVLKWIDSDEIEEHEIDSLIIATGYRFSGLDLVDCEKCGLQLNADGTIDGLYRHLVTIKHPTMAILTVLRQVINYPLIHTQILYYMKTLLGEGKPFPNKEAMLAEMERDTAHRQAIGFRPKDRHYCNVDLFVDYLKMLQADAYIEPLPPVKLKLFVELFKVRDERPYTYKQINYKLVDENNYESKEVE